MDSLKERNMADEYIYFDVESFHQFLEFIIGIKVLIEALGPSIFSSLAVKYLVDDKSYLFN